jgi:hypothetical protein
MESKALALGMQVKAEALNSNIHQMEVTLLITSVLRDIYKEEVRTKFIASEKKVDPLF